MIYCGTTLRQSPAFSRRNIQKKKNRANDSSITCMTNDTNGMTPKNHSNIRAMSTNMKVRILRVVICGILYLSSRHFIDLNVGGKRKIPNSCWIPGFAGMTEALRIDFTFYLFFRGFFLPNVSIFLSAIFFSSSTISSPK